MLDADIFYIPIVSFIVGLIFCFLGRKILGFIVVLFGFFIGFGWLSPLLASIFGVSLHSTPWVAWVAGLIGAGLGLLAWKVSVFLAGCVVGLFAARGFLPSSSGIIHIAIALASGTVVHVYKDPIISLLTAIAGAYVATGSAMIMLNRIGFTDAVARFINASNPAPVIAAVLLLILVIMGYKFQARSFGS